MKVVVIGGTGHVGTYLVPRLVEAGHIVTVVSRGQREPYRPHGAWQQVTRVTIDRQAAEAEGTFGSQILELEPDAVIDMICFTLESAHHLVEALRGQISHFLHTSTVWVHGFVTQVPIREEQPRYPIGEYGTRKAAIEAYLHEQARKTGFPETCILPGHIVGPGWVPLNPTGNFDPSVYGQLARGEDVLLPDEGRAIVHHVHADDVAQLFMLALQNWNAALGESFHAVSPAALTLRGYAEAVAGWFGQEANLSFKPLIEWQREVGDKEAVQATLGHLEHSPNCYSIAKAQRLLNYCPRYTSLQAVKEAVEWLIAHDIVKM